MHVVDNSILQLLSNRTISFDFVMSKSNLMDPFIIGLSRENGLGVDEDEFKV